MSPNEEETLAFYILIGLWVLKLLIGLLMKFFYEEERNETFGYRTEFAMRNADTWLVANRYFGNALFISTLCFLTLEILLFFVIGKAQVTLLFSAFSISLMIVPAFALTESHLDKIFDKNGNRRQS